MSKVRLKPIHRQVIVITGASSGIGLATAFAAAKQGAKVVLGARSNGALQHAVDQIVGRGGEAVAIYCDVTKYEDVQRLAEAAIRRFGRIDTWVNNAGLGLYGRLDELSLEDCRKLFDVDFWGVVYGSRVALPFLRTVGGALINVGSEVSDAAPPLIGMYAAAKHAVKGFTDALRAEIETIDKAPVAITLIQPTATDTPFPQHARNYLNTEPQLPSPMIDPERVAAAILEAAQTHTRTVRVGLMAKVSSAIARVAPRLADQLAPSFEKQMRSDEAPRDPQGILDKPAGEARIHGHGPGSKAVRHTSPARLSQPAR